MNKDALIVIGCALLLIISGIITCVFSEHDISLDDAGSEMAIYGIETEVG